MLVEARDAIVTHIEQTLASERPGLSVYYDNQPWDVNNLPEEFVHIEVNFDDGYQANIAQNPRTRLHGEVVVAVHTRLGRGSRTALGTLDWFISKLSYASIGGVHVQVQSPRPVNPKPSREWFTQRTIFPFFLTA